MHSYFPYFPWNPHRKLFIPPDRSKLRHKQIQRRAKFDVSTFKHAKFDSGVVLMSFKNQSKRMSNNAKYFWRSKSLLSWFQNSNRSCYCMTLITSYTWYGDTWLPCPSLPRGGGVFFRSEMADEVWFFMIPGLNLCSLCCGMATKKNYAAAFPSLADGRYQSRNVHRVWRMLAGDRCSYLQGRMRALERSVVPFPGVAQSHSTYCKLSCFLCLRH